LTGNWLRKYDKRIQNKRKVNLFAYLCKQKGWLANE
jgi:hypothetical protein